MGLTEQKLVMDLLAWAGNVSSSVLIIFVNKVLMNTTGYGFQYGAPLLIICIFYDACAKLTSVAVSAASPSTCGVNLVHD